MSAITYTHLYVLLDRSGSMSSIANDVIGGYNTFIREQKKVGSDVRVTLVQFDTIDRQEIIAAGIPIDELVELTQDTFVPRGGTPLLDATGLLIARARMNEELRVQNSLPKEDIVFVTVTDGEENESSEYTLRQVKKLIEQCEEQGWTFVFLSAAIDAYGDASRRGMKGGNIQAFSASAHGADLAFTSLSDNVSKLRAEKQAGTWKRDADFFEQKIAEAERRKKDEN